MHNARQAQGRRDKHSSPANTLTRNCNIPLNHRTMGRLPDRNIRTSPWIRPAGIRHCRMSQARNGNPGLGGSHSNRQVELARMPGDTPATSGLGTENRHKRLYGPGQPCNGKTHSSRLQRDYTPLRHRRHPS